MALIYKYMHDPNRLVTIVDTSKTFVIYNVLGTDDRVTLTWIDFNRFYTPYYNAGEIMPDEEKLYIKVPGGPEIKYKILYNKACFMGVNANFIDLGKDLIVYTQVGTSSIFVREEDDFKQNFVPYSKTKERERLMRNLEEAKHQVKLLENDLQRL